MRAVLVKEPGGPEQLHVGEAPDPVVSSRELLVAVRAAGVNRADCLQRMGRYPAPPGISPVLGLELAGEVREAFPGSRFQPGDRVMALVSGGAYAELAAIPESTCLAVPPQLGWAEAAAIPEAFLTAWLNLVELGGLQAGETVLVHAGASGVGSAAIQLAKAMETTVWTTVGSPEKQRFVSGLGVARALNRKQEFFGEVLDPDSVDVVLDFVGAPYWNDNLKVLRRGGRLLVVGFLGGTRGDLDVGAVLRKSLTVRGTTLRGSPPGLKAKLVRDLEAFAQPRFESGALRPLVDLRFPFSEAAAAHEAMEGNRNAGKIILEWES